MESLLFGLISYFQISTSVLTVPVKMEQRVSTLTEVISASVNLDLMESSVNKASCLSSANCPGVMGPAKILRHGG